MGVAETYGTSAFNAPGKFDGVSFAPDGTLLAVVSGETSRVIAYDAAGASLWAHALGARYFHVLALPDGYVVGAHDHIARFDARGDAVWTARTTAGFLFGGPESFATCGRDGIARVWNLDGSMRFEVEAAKGEIFAAAFSPDGSMLALGEQKGRIRLLDARDGSPISTRQSTKTLALAFSPGGELLVSGHGQGNVRCWSVPDLKSDDSFGGAHEFEEHGGPAGCRWVGFQDADHVLSLGNEHLVRRWACDEGEAGRMALSPRHAQGPAVAFHADTDRLAVGSTPGALGVWRSGLSLDPPDLAPGTPCTVQLDDDRVVAATGHGFVSWSRNGGPVRRCALNFPPASIALTADWVVTVDYDRAAVRDELDAEPRLDFELGRYASGDAVVNGSTVAVPTGDRVELWNLETGALTGALPHDAEAKACAFSKDGTWMVTVDDHLRVWQLAEPAVQLWAVQLDQETFSAGVGGVCIGPCGQIAVSLDDNFTPLQELRLYGADGELRWSLEHDSRLGQVGFVDDDRIVVADARGAALVASVTGGAWLECVEPAGGVVDGGLQGELPIAVHDREVAFVGTDGAVNVVSLPPREVDVPVEAPAFVDHGPKEPVGMFEERLAGARFLFTGRFEQTSKKFREESARELGATVTQTANEKVTHLVVGRPKYGVHKASAKEAKISKLNEDGAAIAVLSEQEMIDLFLPTLAESTQMLRNDVDRWNRWRERFELPSGVYPASLGGIDLEGADLTRANLAALQLHEANLRGASLSGCRLVDAELTGADLTGANLSGVNAYRARFSRATLRGADLSSGDFTWAKFDGADLSDAKIDGAEFLQADFTGAVGAPE